VTDARAEQSKSAQNKNRGRENIGLVGVDSMWGIVALDARSVA